MSKINDIAIDVDEPCAALIQYWIVERYNEDWHDNLQKRQLTDWDIAQFVKPECGLKVYDYLKMRDMYDHVSPTPLSFAGVQTLRDMGKRIIYVTRSTIEQSGIKYYWLKRFGFIESEDDYFEAKDKSMIRADVLFDDGFHNVSSFRGVGMLLNAPWNAKYQWDIRLNNWYQFVDLIKRIDE